MLRRLYAVVVSSCVETVEIPNRHHGLRLIERHPGRYAIAKGTKDRFGVLGEALCGITAHPAVYAIIPEFKCCDILTAALNASRRAPRLSHS
jgi:hypothetical protein